MARRLKNEGCNGADGDFCDKWVMGADFMVMPFLNVESSVEGDLTIDV